MLLSDRELTASNSNCCITLSLIKRGSAADLEALASIKRISVNLLNLLRNCVDVNPLTKSNGLLGSTLLSKIPPDSKLANTASNKLPKIDSTPLDFNSLPVDRLLAAAPPIALVPELIALPSNGENTFFSALKSS